MPLYTKDGKIIKNAGKLAKAEACCCDGVDCTCCNFAEGDTLLATASCDSCIIDGLSGTLTYNGVTKCFSGSITWDGGLHAFPFSLCCNEGVWEADGPDLCGVDATTTNFSCGGNGSAIWNSCIESDPYFPDAQSLTITFSDLTSITAQECFCCDCPAVLAFFTWPGGDPGLTMVPLTYDEETCVHSTADNTPDGSFSITYDCHTEIGSFSYIGTYGTIAENGSGYIGITGTPSVRISFAGGSVTLSCS